jgi:hypothetical protein
MGADTGPMGILGVEVMSMGHGRNAWRGVQLGPRQAAAGGAPRYLRATGTPAGRIHGERLATGQYLRGSRVQEYSMPRNLLANKEIH